MILLEAAAHLYVVQDPQPDAFLVHLQSSPRAADIGECRARCAVSGVTRAGLGAVMRGCRAESFTNSGNWFHSTRRSKAELLNARLDGAAH